jgi:cell division protein FtsQ
MSGKRELTRAEIVRQRRAQYNNHRLKHASELAYRPMPPVTTRGVTYVRQKQKTLPARRFSISLSLPAVSLPAAALAKEGLGWRALSALLVLILGAAMFFAWSSPALRVTNALVSGNVRLSAEEINAVLGVSGQPIFMLVPSQIADRLRQNYHELASAEVRVYLPNKVWVRVTERMPIIEWQQGDGYTWIDATGMAFHPRGAVAGLIPVKALATPPTELTPSEDPLNPTPYLDREMVTAIQLLAPSVPAGTTMIYDPQNGIGWTDGRGWQVFFGDSKELTLKLRVYQSLVDSLTGRGIVPAFISVVYPDAPFYRMSDTSQEGPLSNVSDTNDQ